MELGKYSDGRSLNYDEATQQFDVGGAPVTLADVIGYDKAGQVDWLSDDLRSWAQNLESGQAAETQSPDAKPSPSAVTPSGKRLFGFRSRQPWKMIVASLYYLFAVVISIGLIVSRKPYATSGTDVAVEVLSGLLLSLILLSPAFLLSDFGYRDRLPLFKRRKLVWSALGLALFFVLMLVTSALADTLHTQPYKVAAAAEKAAQEKEAAKRQAEADAKKAAEAKRQAEADAKKAAEADAKAAAEASATAEAKRLADAKKAAEASAAAAAAAQKPAPKPVEEQSPAAEKTYPFQTPSSILASTPERVVAEYATAWKAKDWKGMVDATDQSSRNRESDLAGQLKSWYDFKVLKGFEIQKVNRVSDVAADVTYAVWYESEFNGMQAKVVTAKVLKMTSDGSLNAHGEWGINPTSALRENDK